MFQPGSCTNKLKWFNIIRIVVRWRKEKNETRFIERRVLSIPPEPIRYVTISMIRSFLGYEDKLGGKWTNFDLF